MVTFVVMALVLASCATTPGGLRMGELPAPELVRQRLEARQQMVRSFSMQGSLEIATPTAELNGDHLIYGKHPDRLRAEVIGSFGRPLLLLICDSRRIFALDYSSNRAYLGRASRANMERFFGLPLSPSEIYAMLSGNAPLLHSSGANIHPGPKPGQALLKLMEPGASMVQGVVFDLSDYAVRRSWLRRNGDGSDQGQNFSGESGPVMDLNFSAFKAFSIGRLPMEIEMKQGRDRTVGIFNEEMTPNPDLDGAIFEISPPPGIEVKELE